METELELLPPNKKLECPDCKGKFRHLERCFDKIKRCKMCKRKLPTNKYYTPPEKQKPRVEFIGNFNIVSPEKQVLYHRFRKEGSTHEQAMNKLRSHEGILKAQRGRRVIIKTNPQEEFLKGLGQKQNGSI